MRVVVTGGAGFIGSAFINKLLDLNKDVEVLCVDKLTYAGKRVNIKHNVPFLQKDICDVTPEDLGQYDYLVHFAAESHVDNSIKDGKPFVRTNVEGTFNMIECARQNPKLKSSSTYQLMRCTVIWVILFGTLTIELSRVIL